jgi:hypothetical protein
MFDTVYAARFIYIIFISYVRARKRIFQDIPKGTFTGKYSAPSARHQYLPPP